MTSERACALAALILADDGLEVTAERILAVTDAAGITVEPVWASLYEKALKGTDVNKLLTSFSSAPAPAAAAPVAAASAPAGGKKEAAKEAPKKEESDDEIGGFGLFD